VENKIFVGLEAVMIKTSWLQMMMGDTRSARPLITEYLRGKEEIRKLPLEDFMNLAEQDLIELKLRFGNGPSIEEFLTLATQLKDCDSQIIFSGIFNSYEFLINGCTASANEQFSEDEEEIFTQFVLKHDPDNWEFFMQRYFKCEWE